MRVLIATDAWEPQVNGVVRSLQYLIAEGPALGITFEVISPADFRSVPMPGYREIRLAGVTPRSIARRILAFRPDAIHIATEGPIGWAARRAALKARLAIVTSYHTRFPEYLAARLPVPKAMSYAVLRRFHNAADAVLVATPTLEADLRARGFQNLRHWSRGVDLSRFAPRTVDLGHWPRPVFLYVGRLAVEKNLEAFLGLDLPGTKLVVGDGPQREELATRFPQTIFTGAKQGAELAELYAQGDVFVFPSRTDTFGMVVLEALASGLPVAAYPVMGPRDILGENPEQDGTGALDEDLGRAARACLELRGDGPQRLAQRFSWTAAGQQFRDATIEAIARCAERPASHAKG
jgi:glycosyltransferase involved in cell wall biosynthesis